MLSRRGWWLVESAAGPGLAPGRVAWAAIAALVTVSLAGCDGAAAPQTPVADPRGASAAVTPVASAGSGTDTSTAAAAGEATSGNGGGLALGTDTGGTLAQGTDTAGTKAPAPADGDVDRAAAPAVTAVRLARLTPSGCCPMPFWSADGRTVLFWFDPAESGSTGTPGVYGVAVTGGSPTFVAELPSGVHLAGRFTTQSSGDAVILTRSSDARTWTLDTDGAAIVVAPDGSAAAWVEGLGDAVPGQRPPRGVNRRVDLSTGEVTTVDVPEGYVLSDWTAEGAWLLSLQDRASDLPDLVRFDLVTGETRPVLSGERLRAGRTSPDRRWLAITRTFEADPAASGLYIASADGVGVPRRIELFGAYRWRDAGRLLVVPAEPGASSMTLWQVDAATGAARPLSDPTSTPFRIAAGEWSVAPDGAHVAFRSADDDAVWLMTLPATD